MFENFLLQTWSGDLLRPQPLSFAPLPTARVFRVWIISGTLPSPRFSKLPVSWPWLAACGTGSPDPPPPAPQRCPAGRCCPPPSPAPRNWNWHHRSPIVAYLVVELCADRSGRSLAPQQRSWAALLAQF
eukprot:EG_transcript_35741